MSNNYHLQYFIHLGPPTSKHTNLMCGKLCLQFVKSYKLDQPSSLSIAYVTVDIYVKREVKGGMHIEKTPSPFNLFNVMLERGAARNRHNSTMN